MKFKPHKKARVVRHPESTYQQLETMGQLRKFIQEYGEKKGWRLQRVKTFGDHIVDAFEKADRYSISTPDEGCFRIEHDLADNMRVFADYKGFIQVRGRW